MTPRERMLCAMHKRETDRIPWATLDCLLPRGYVERKIREKGCGLNMVMPPWSYQMERREVTIEEKRTWDQHKRAQIIMRTYHTPLGSVSQKAQLRLGLSSNKQEWITEHMIKDVSDYPIVKFIIENTRYYKDYDSFLEAQEDLGDDGIAVAFGETPMHMMIWYLMGIYRFSIDLYEHPQEFKELASLLEEKYDEMYKIIADSPAELVIGGENLSGDIISPPLFEKYSAPFHDKQAQLMHEKGKIYGVHCDGRLNSLKDLIKKTDIDVIDSFTLPEGGGDLSLKEAKKLWKDKAIWVNFPASLCHENEEKIREVLIQIFREVTPGDGFMLEYSEDLPPNLWKKTLIVIAETMEKYGDYSLALRHFREKRKHKP